MAFEFHTNTRWKFDQQYENARDYMIPFIREKFPLKKELQVAEIGCGEGGVLKAFWELGCDCTGIELEAQRVEKGSELLEDEIASGRFRFITENVYDLNFDEYREKFDLIIFKDAIEHIPEQEKIISYMRRLLAPGGAMFFGFPPWRMPFGGHQQLIKHKLLSKAPYYHLLPRPFYKGILKTFGETPDKIEGMLEIYDTRISINRFERIVKKTGYKILNRRFYLINPIYKYKFGFKPRKQIGLISALPWIRDFYTTTVYYLIGKIDDVSGKVPDERENA